MVLIGVQVIFMKGRAVTDGQNNLAGMVEVSSGYFSLTLFRENNLKGCKSGLRVIFSVIGPARIT